MRRPALALLAAASLLGRAATATAQTLGPGEPGSRQIARGPTRSPDGRPGPGYWQLGGPWGPP